MAQLVVHSDNGNLATAKVCIVAHLLERAITLRPIDLSSRENRTPAFLAKSPYGFLPLLDEPAITLAAPICMHLVTRTNLAPSLACEEWIEWDALFNAEAVHWIAAQAGVELSEERIAASAAKGRSRLARLEAALQRTSHLTGDTLTLADVFAWCSVAPLFSEATAPVRTECPAVARWFDALQTHVSFQAGLAAAHVDLFNLEPTAQRYSFFFRNAERPKYRLSDAPERPVYLTTPIYYATAAPHIGHVYTTLLADVVARWCDLRGIPAVLQSGTDEHGQKLAQAAEGARHDAQAVHR